MQGRLEVVSNDFALGWAENGDGDAPAHLHATLDGQVIGAGSAFLRRDDLDQIAAKGNFRARGFLVLFDRQIQNDKLSKIELYFDHNEAAILKSPRLRIDKNPRLRVFILGSPRSGTSELGDTLAKVLGLPWLGEGHAAPLFAKAAEALTGDSKSQNGFVRLVAEQNLRQVAIDTARIAYYAVHASGSFLDKTPGHAMISASPFLLECFPDAYFIFLRRNGISNILSRMAKFGGNFDHHCADWAATMREWIKVKELLPHYLEIEQERMLDDPDSVANKVSSYLNVADRGDSIVQFLRSGTRERTGAGIGRSRLSQTDWPADKIQRFKQICGPMMEAFSYELDS